MNWNQRYPKSEQPALSDFASFIGNPLWADLCAWAETSYGAAPKVEHSVCSGAPGWNVKYKKGGRSLCTLYPDEGSFTALITVGAKESPQAELLLPSFSAYLRELYAQTREFNGARWLMIRVAEPPVLDDVKRLIALRVPLRAETKRE